MVNTKWFFTPACCLLFATLSACATTGSESAGGQADVESSTWQGALSLRAAPASAGFLQFSSCNSDASCPADQYCAIQPSSVG